ncbi:MAG TPA: hypothetical protein PK990_06885, partial [Salinivirgaceae bacterium]|nr:hypothetical protein [Salinivirgaceae bacterium]
MVNKNIPRLNEQFDPVVFFLIIRKNLLPPLLILLFAGISVFLYLRYTPPVYLAQSIIQITPDETPNKILQITEVDDSKNIGKTITLMNSKEFIKRCLKNLPFEIRYYVKGTFLVTELYKSTPFKVEKRNINQQTQGIPIFVDFLSKDSCRVSCSIDQRVYNTKTATNEWFVLDGNLFKITIENYQAILDKEKSDPNNRYFFTIHDENQILNELISNLTIRILNPQDLTIEIAYRSNNANQAADVVNLIAEEFRFYEVEKKSESVKNILKFIDNQLGLIYNTLDKIENDIHDFKTKYNIKDKLIQESP